MIETLVTFTNEISRYIIPILLAGIPFYGITVKKVKVYECFVEGAKDGFTIAVRIIPYLVAILVAIGMFRASGALDMLLTLLSPVLNFIGFPPENLPLALMRPLSGSGSLGLLTDLINQHGPDSLIAKIGATMFGSTETTFYVLAVYFGSVGIRRSRHALAAGLIADTVGVFSAVYICQLLFTVPALTNHNIGKHNLVDIQTLDSSIFVELKYSSTDNFMNKDVYGNLEKCYLRDVPAQMLAKANFFLKESYPGHRLLVYDGLRPRSIQWKLWNTIDNIPEPERTQFVADPRSGSIHNFGAAVDLTLADSSGNPLDMGTKYDFFGELAFPVLEDSLLEIGKLTSEQLTNRKILRNAMEAAGFTPITTEWWHFNAFPYQETKSKYDIIE